MKTCLKLFQNYLRGLLQLTNFSSMFNVAEIISQLFQNDFVSHATTVLSRVAIPGSRPLFQSRNCRDWAPGFPNYKIIYLICFVLFYRASSYASAVLAIVILSVSPSVCLSACFVTKPSNALRMFWYHTKGQSLCYSDTNSGWWARPLSSEIWAQNDSPPIWAQNDSPPSRNADFYRFPFMTSQP